MKIAVFGAGATGGHFAVLLAQSGVDVSVVVRGATLQAVRSSGLTLRTVLARPSRLVKSPQ